MMDVHNLKQNASTNKKTNMGDLSRQRDIERMGMLTGEELRKDARLGEEHHGLVGIHRQ